MGSALLTKGTLVVDETVRARAVQIVEEAGDERLLELFLATKTGRTLPLSAELAEFIDHILRRVAQGGSVSVVTMPEMLSTSAAADLLGVSRPTLMKLIRDGELVPEMAGTHHRLRHSDVEALRTRRENERHSTFEEMRAVDDDLGR
ncbi:helix-turn-helix domain-containing protein [Microbacterium aurum]|uniref:helix-turn-helix domain-containing protein n=1 Tax=Microbacterium aurum TaxID=36805 RepID=UPI0028EDC636|nr:helix-turn-helix domain-containing protein [Microbacterium aurum]